MMKKLIPILLLFFFTVLLLFSACRKNDIADSTPLIIDSLIDDSRMYWHYIVDVNGDHTGDIKLGWRRLPGALSVSTYFVVALSPSTKIHVVQQTVAICRDTTGPVGGQQIITRNCTGSGTQIRIDTLMAPPKLDSSAIYNTVFNSNQNSDSLLLYKYTFLYSMPFAPYYYGEETTHGFWTTPGPGYLLFKVDEKRYALKLFEGAKYVVTLIKIDP